MATLGKPTAACKGLLRSLSGDVVDAILGARQWLTSSVSCCSSSIVIRVSCSAVATFVLHG
jgi:hypothetical protein